MIRPLGVQQSSGSTSAQTGTASMSGGEQQGGQHSQKRSLSAMCRRMQRCVLGLPIMPRL